MVAPATALPALRFRELGKHYGRHRVLNRVCLKVQPGESFALVGVNGAGKTTCIKILLDFCAATAGSVEIFGIDSRQPRARASLSYLPERFMPPYYLQGREFLHYMARLHGRVFCPDEVEKTLHAIGLDSGALTLPVRRYSKGMAQKLGLAACFLSDKPLLILDEPMSGLDPKARLLVKRHLQGLRSVGKTLFFSTHILADVASLCDRMAILHDGVLKFTGAPADCCRAYGTDSLEEAYLGCISENA